MSAAEVVDVKHAMPSEVVEWCDSNRSVQKWLRVRVPVFTTSTSEPWNRGDVLYEGFLTDTDVEQLDYARGTKTMHTNPESLRRHVCSVPVCLYDKHPNYLDRKVVVRFEYLDAVPKPQAVPNPADPNGTALLFTLQKNAARIQHLHAHGKSVDHEFAQEMMRELSMFEF